MTATPRTVAHKHVPLCRVIRRGWADPLDTSYSQRASADNRWNTPDFPALYCGCSERVSRAVARDIFRLAGIGFEDLQDAMLPQLVEIAWAGEVVDVASPEGVAAAGFPLDYPVGINKNSMIGLGTSCLMTSGIQRRIQNGRSFMAQKIGAPM